MSRHSKQNPYTAPASIEEQSFYGIIAAGARDGELRIKKRVRRFAATILSLLVSIALCCCGTFLWWDIQGKAKRARMEAENSCVQQFGSMTESYNEAFRLYGQVASKFSELDESYDLDALAALQDKKPEGYKLLRCSTDLDGDVLKASWRKTGVTTVKANLHKRLATGSKSGRYKLTLDVKAADIATVTMRNTVISDPLSKWVDPVGLADGKGTGITVTKDGKTMTSGYTATYDAKTRTVKVALPGDLADNSTYQVAFEVSLSDTARLDYMRNGTYPDTSDADTGLNAGKKGYCTNGDATLTWDAVTTVDGVPTTVPSKAAYPKPVATWSGANLPAPSVLTNYLPGTGGTASLIPVIAGTGIAIAIAAVWVIRRYLI